MAFEVEYPGPFSPDEKEYLKNSFEVIIKEKWVPLSLSTTSPSWTLRVRHYDSQHIAVLSVNGGDYILREELLPKPEDISSVQKNASYSIINEFEHKFTDAAHLYRVSQNPE